MPPATACRHLALLLKIFGWVTATAVIGVVLPFSWMDAAHRAIGLGPLPDVPVVGYLARTLSLVYVLLGGVFVIVGRDVDRYRPLIACLFLAIIALGVVGGLILVCTGMPILWLIVESPGTIAIPCFGLWLWRRAAAGS